MEIVSPHKNLFDDALVKYKRYNIFIICAFVLTTVQNILKVYNFNNVYLLHTLDIVSVLSAVAIWYEERSYASKFVDAENERKKGLLDKSFGTKYAHFESVNYYDTDEISYGFNKLLANLHESSIYTKYEAKYMLKRQFLITTVGMIFIIACAYMGFRSLAISPLILEFFLTYIILGRYFDLKELVSIANNIENEANQLWVLLEENHNVNIQAKILNLLLQYETTIASLKITLSNESYIKCNQIALSDWNSIKLRYKIK